MDEIDINLPLDEALQRVSELAYGAAVTPDEKFELLADIRDTAQDGMSQWRANKAEALEREVQALRAARDAR